jgi:hypothetical protein
MSNTVKIERNGVEAEVLERYLLDFIRDGWVKKEDNASDKKDKTIL